jgi:hypothetical protein
MPGLPFKLPNMEVNIEMWHHDMLEVRDHETNLLGRHRKSKVVILLTPHRKMAGVIQNHVNTLR